MSFRLSPCDECIPAGQPYDPNMDGNNQPQCCPPGVHGAQTGSCDKKTQGQLITWECK